LNGRGVSAGAASDPLPELAPLVRLHPQGIHGDVKIFALLNPAPDSANKRERFLNCRSLISWAVKVTIPYGLIDHELYMGLCLAAALLILRYAEFSDEIIRIGIVREN
jgi:hypothetical protein